MMNSFIKESWLLLIGGAIGLLPTIVTKLRNKDKRTADIIDNVQRILSIQDGKIAAQEKSIERLTFELETLRTTNDRYRRFIRSAIYCKTPNNECPVLTKQQQWDNRQEHEAQA